MDKLVLTPISCELRGFRYWVFDGEPMGRTLIQTGDWEPHVRKFLEAFLKPGDYFIDVGAAFGVHTLTAARIVGETGCVFAFEPQSAVFSLLQRNCAENGLKNVELFCAAAASRSGVAGLSPVRMEAIGPALADVFLVNANQSTVKVHCIALDQGNFRKPITAIKIDVQGAEQAVLEGASQLIARDRPCLIMEFEEYCARRYNTTCPVLFAHLRRLGYYTFFLDHFYPADHVSIPQERLEEFRASFAGSIRPHTEPNELNQNFQSGVVEKICL